MAQFDIDQTTETLERDGIVVLPNFLQGAALASIQDSFTRALEWPAFNTRSGYEMIEKWRVQLENLLLIDPHCYSDCALHPLVTEVVRRRRRPGRRACRGARLEDDPHPAQLPRLARRCLVPSFGGGDEAARSEAGGRI